MNPLVRMIKLNNVQFNANRDPQVYRRCPNEKFQLEAVLQGSGRARCTITEASGKVLDEQEVTTPGIYACELAFATPGTRLITLSITAGAESCSRDLRLDVMEHKWVG
jgi:hypothetical protein